MKAVIAACFKPQSRRFWVVGRGSSMNWSEKRPVLPRSVYSSIRLFALRNIEEEVGEVPDLVVAR